MSGQRTQAYPTIWSMSGTSFIPLAVSYNYSPGPNNRPFCLYVLGKCWPSAQFE